MLPDNFLNITPDFSLCNSNTLVPSSPSASSSSFALSTPSTSTAPAASVSQVALTKRTLLPAPGKCTRAFTPEIESGGKKDHDGDYGRNKRTRVSARAANKGKAPTTTATGRLERDQVEAPQTPRSFSAFHQHEFTTFSIFLGTSCITRHQVQIPS
jgi:hypothetical protein